MTVPDHVLRGERGDLMATSMDIKRWTDNILTIRSELRTALRRWLGTPLEREIRELLTATDASLGRLQELQALLDSRRGVDNV